MGYYELQTLERLREADWIHLIESLCALECRHLLGEVSVPDYRRLRGALLAGCHCRSALENRHWTNDSYENEAV